jgi:hypothetical protein
LIAALSVLSAVAAQPTEAEWAKLVAGDVVTRMAPELEPDGAYGWVEIAAPPERIWAALTDPAVAVAASSAVKECTAYLDEPLPGGGRRVGWAYTLNVALSEVRYHLIRDLRPAEARMTWTLDPSRDNDLVLSTGSYGIGPGRTAGKALLTYESQLDSGRRIPAWIQQFLAGRALVSFLDRVRDTAQGQ